MTTVQADILFIMHKHGERVAAITVSEPPITADSEGLKGAANAIPKIFGPTGDGEAVVTRVERHANLFLVWSEGGEHAEAVGNFMIAIVALFGWNRDDLVVLEQLPDGKSQKWRVGRSGSYPEWTHA